MENCQALCIRYVANFYALVPPAGNLGWGGQQEVKIKSDSWSLSAMISAGTLTLKPTKLFHRIIAK